MVVNSQSLISKDENWPSIVLGPHTSKVGRLVISKDGWMDSQMGYRMMHACLNLTIDKATKCTFNYTSISKSTNFFYIVSTQVIYI